MDKKELLNAQKKLKQIRKSISIQRTELAKIQENIFLSEAIADRLKELIDREILKNY